MEKSDLKERTKEFALKIIKMVESLPRGRTADILGGQLLRSGTSVGANYRAACRAKSPTDFIKICQNTLQLCWGDEWPPLSPETVS